MLEVMTQATRIAHLDHPFGDWPLAFSAVPAAVMGLGGRGRLKAGAPADLCCSRRATCRRCSHAARPTAVVLRSGRRSTPRCRTIAPSTSIVGPGA
jgi:cytosine deaminase